MNYKNFNSIDERNEWLFPIKKLLSHYQYFCILQTLNSLNEYYGEYELIIGASNHSQNIKFEDFDTKKWLLGGFSYTFKEFIEPKCKNSKKETINFPEIAIFEPEIILYIKNNEPLKVFIEGNLPDNQFNEIEFEKLSFKQIYSNITFNEYIKKLKTIFDYLKKGDIYEINFAIEYLVEDLMINPLYFYEILTKKSPTPQSGILKWEDRWLICASQERFLKKFNDILISQPIKGTISRSCDNDFNNVLSLYQSYKNRSENVMIVDLVRNDLNRCCEPGTVKVERLFQIQSYEYLHQMVSTIVGKPLKNLKNIEIIKALFPAGSMTGCPKISAMNIIEELEPSGRGIYSGSIGYFHQGNFDFNVVIRSLVWNQSQKLGSFHVGGAITLNSNPFDEYDECQVKAKAILNVIKKNCK